MIVFLSALISLLLVGVLYLLNTLSPPTWAVNNKKEWKNSKITSLLFSLTSIIACYFLLPVAQLSWRISISANLTLITYVLGQSIITDLKLFLVDRKTLYTSIILSFLTSIFWVIQNEYYIILLFMLISTVLIISFMQLLPVVGASDYRTLLLMLITSPPFYYYTPLNKINNMLFIMMGLIILLSILYVTIKHFTQKEKILKTKTPLVPILLIPYLIINITNLITMIQ